MEGGIGSVLEPRRCISMLLRMWSVSNWQNRESGTSNRITMLQGHDTGRPQQQVDNISDENLLRKRNRDLRTYLSIIGKCVSLGHYFSVIRHSASFENICNNLRKDYDIQKKAFIFLTYWGSVTTIGKAHESNRRVTLYFISFIAISGDFIHFLPTN